MRVTRAIIGAAALAAAMTVGGTSTVSAETILRFNNVLPPKHIIRTEGWDVWAKEVAAATSNRVRVEFSTKPLGVLPRVFDIIRDGVADVGWGVHGYTPGRFTSAEIVEIPFLATTGEALSVAFWRVHQKHFAKANEYRGIHLLSIHTHSPGSVFTASKPLTKLEDLKGLKIRIANRATSEILKIYGGAPVREPAPKVSQLLFKGVIDGTFFTADAISAFHLGDKIKNWLRFDTGLYNSSFFLAINPGTWKKISAADQAAITKVSGEHFARIMGASWDRSQRRGEALMKSNGTKISDPSPADMKAVRAKLAVFETKWIAKVKKRGIDGAAALKMLRAEIAAYKVK
jgi:TRAP-type C4-dicarboxylate transport system substrate-binding protein